MDKKNDQNSKGEPLSKFIKGMLPQIRKTKRVCKECGAEFEALDIGKFTRGHCDACSTTKAREDEQGIALKAAYEKEKRFKVLVTQAQIPPLWQEVDFGNSNPNIYPWAFKRAKKYAEEFTIKSPSLILYAPQNGTGKTHMAACIANYVLHQYRYSVLYKKARDLMLDIRRTFSDKGDNEANILDRVLSVKLLVLDDVGMDTPSEWIKSTYWTVFDRRLEWQLPVVVTTNRQVEGDLEQYIGQGAVSRLIGLSRGNVIDMSGEDLR